MLGGHAPTSAGDALANLIFNLAKVKMRDHGASEALEKEQQKAQGAAGAAAGGGGGTAAAPRSAAKAKAAKGAR